MIDATRKRTFYPALVVGSTDGQKNFIQIEQY